MMKKIIIKFIVPIVIVVACVVVAKAIISNPPSNERKAPSQVPQLNVEAITLNRTDFTVEVSSYGTVQPRTQGGLVSQVSGQIIRISDNFQAGGFFEKGDVLVEIDDRDYLADVQIAQSNLLSAKQNLIEENARVEQAQQDWQRLGNTKKAPDLVLRKPQLLAAQAQVFSAQASLERAKLTLERTKIIAPYRGRILKKEADLGQVISTNTRLAELYAIDYVEIRLPINNSDLPYTQLPESSRLETPKATDFPVVELTSALNENQQWQGQVVRTEGAFDSASQQLFVVAQINDPYGHYLANELPIKMGQYVSAKIQGKTVTDALAIPNKAIYQGSYVYTVVDNKLLRKTIDIAWQNSDVAIIKTGLTSGEKLVVTTLGQVNSGTVVNVSKLDNNEVTPVRQRPKGKRGEGKPNRKEGKQALDKKEGERS